MAAGKPLKRKEKQTREAAPAPAECSAEISSPDADLFPVVGFGASAGGLEAFTDLLTHVPSECGFALVLVQHLDPKRASILTELLSRFSEMRVVQVTDGIAVKPNHVYVIPPNTNMSISGGALRLEPRPPAGPHMPIDHFFRSLAQDRGNRAVGVILSGTAFDGTLGLKAVKAEGGITFAQEPGSAKYDGMPRSAIAAGCVDFVLPVDQIAHELIRLRRHPYLNGQPAAAADSTAGDEAAFNEIFGMLRSATGVDFSYYKPGTIRRRTMRRMALRKMDKVQDYCGYIKANRGELRSLFQDILVNVTGFFREPATFEALKSRVLPLLFSRRSSEEPIRVWAPGCATGEEVYSIAILLLEYMREAESEIPLQIFGTDLSESALERARAGIYPDTIASDVSSERLRRFFIRVNGTYQIVRSVRDVCVFARQNVTKDPPFSKLDIIICRNLLIYLGPVLQMTVMRLFHYALRPNAFLVLGNSETIGNAGELFGPIDKQLKIYSRKAAPTVITTGLEAYEKAARPHVPLREIPGPAGALDSQRRVDQWLVAHYSPAAVVVDKNLQVLQVRGQTSWCLEHTPGDANLDLLKMTPSGLGLEVRRLVRKAETTEAAVRSKRIPVSLKEGLRAVRVSVNPILSPNPSGPQFLVVFEPVPSAPAREKDHRGKAAKGAAGATRVRQLEQELATTREYLQTIIEEQEASAEELKSAHEEVQSANEELQSTNEELLTAKEELQSTNEELTTVNEEMQSRNAELQRVNNDLLNLLSSVSISIVMLGNDLRIRRFTPQAEKLLNLLPTDVGRPISDFRLKINFPDLAALCQDVVDNLAAREREVQDSEGRTYSMWIRPCRTAENKIDGVVLAMCDITERRQSPEARYHRLFEAAADGIVVADAKTGVIVDLNPIVTRLFGYPRSHLVGGKFWESPLFQGSGVDESLLAQIHEMESIQKVLSLPSFSGGRVETDIVGSIYAEGDKKVIQFNIRDMTALKRMEEQSRRDEEQLAQAQKLEAVGRLAGGVAHDFNNVLTAILGYCDLLEEEMQGGDAVRDNLGQIRSAAERATLLTRQLLAFGRRRVLHPAVLDLNELVTDIRQLIGVMLTRGIELTVELQPDTWYVKADRGQLEQALLNLILNARDAMPGGGTITVRTANTTVDETFAGRHPAVPLGQYVSLTVQDNGTGMDAETQARMFEPFFTTKPKGKGAGLGLSTVFAIVKQCDGHIMAYSELGVGATFTIFLPRVTAEPVAQEAAHPEPEESHGTETILLVEDEVAVRFLTRHMLESRGYQILEASSGPEALRISAEYEGPIHLLLTDVVLPRMSGREVAFQLAPKRPEMKALYISGHTEDTIVHHGVLEDRMAFLQKPFTQGVLAAKLREILDRDRAARPANNACAAEDHTSARI